MKYLIFERLYIYLQKKAWTQHQKKLAYFGLFILSVIVFFVVLYSPIGSYCSMILPFNTTFLAKALDLL